jgi:hypothetical protein
MDTHHPPPAVGVDDSDAPVPRRRAELPEDPHVRQIAASLDCVTSGEFRALAGITPSTEEAWRKRGTGPDYVLLGNAVLYPREALKTFISRRLRERHKTPARSTL